MSTKKFYLTSAIPYVNAPPHIGHAYEFVIADSLARYHSLIGEDTLYLTGADENALKNVLAAEKLGVTPQQLCDANSEIFKKLLVLLNVKNDIFQRGSDQKKHWPGVIKLWELCQKDVYQKTYEGLYCLSCEVFYNLKELTNGLCPTHKTKPEKVKEENYFFALSKYQNQLIKIIENEEIKIVPESRKNETLSFIKQGLEDISISRSNERARNWGVPVLEDPSQRIYVWFDALDIYQTGIGFGTDEKEYQKWWPADLHVIGKDIYRFHTVYWPAILLSAGLKLPKKILIHGFLNIQGEKMSKTLGNVIDPFAFINNLKNKGVNLATDALRFYLLNSPIFDDGDFNFEKFTEVYNAHLANGLGNLIARIAKLASSINLEVELIKEQPLLDAPYQIQMENFRFNDALAYIWKKIAFENKKIETAKLWELVKTDSEQAKRALENSVRQIREIAELLLPLLPETAAKIQEQFKGPEIKVSPILFPRI